MAWCCKFDIKKAQGLISDKIVYDVKTIDEALDKFKEHVNSFKYPVILKEIRNLSMEEV